jgi:hypothetical protein
VWGGTGDGGVGGTSSSAAHRLQVTEGSETVPFVPALAAGGLAACVCPKRVSAGFAAAGCHVAMVTPALLRDHVRVAGRVNLLLIANPIVEPFQQLMLHCSFVRFPSVTSHRPWLITHVAWIMIYQHRTPTCVCSMQHTLCSACVAQLVVCIVASILQRTQ